MKTLKLDSSYRPVEVISAQDAFCMVYMGRANIVETYDNVEYTSAYKSYPVPCVISLNRFIKINKSPLKCNKRNILWRDRNTCQYCKSILPSNSLTLDHVTPKSKGGPRSWQNIVTCCHGCNQKKGNKMPREAGMVPFVTPCVPPMHLFAVLSPKDMHPKWEVYLNRYENL